MGEHIFISYRSIEAAFTLKLAADLKNRGVPIWMDRLETGIRAGDDWRRAIETAINTCTSMISILSPDYVQSEYCRNEMARANRLGRAIMPVLLRPVPNEAWPIELERVQYVDFRNWQDETGYSRSFEELVVILREKAATRTGPLPDLETQYMTSLVSELEARRGVLEYVDLSGSAEVRDRPNPHSDEGWNAEFTLLLPSDIDQSAGKRIALSGINEAIEQHQRFVLIGDPGAGKTTTIRHLALQSARDRLANPRTAPLPVFLFLPQWEPRQTVLEFIAAHYPLKTDNLAEQIAQGEILLFLDGLNEMGADGSTRIRQLFQWLRVPPTPRRVIVTCRADIYNGEVELGLPVVFVEAMDEARIRQFVKNYLGNSADTLLKRILPEGQASSAAGRDLFQLARNPYLLAALVYIYANSPSGDLPQNVGALFRGLVRALWSREQTKQTSGWVPFDQMERRLAQLAFVMVDEDKPIDVPHDYVLQFLGNENLLNAVRSANLLESNRGQVRFYHQLMQEYFAAVGLANIDLAGKIEPPRFGYGGRMPTKWDEVIRSLCAIVPDTEATLRQLLILDPWLAVKGINSGVQISESTRLATQVELLRALDSPDWSTRAAAARALGELGAPNAIDALVRTLDDSVWYVSRMAKQALEKLGGPPVSEIMLSELRAEKSSTHVGAYQIIEPLGKGGMTAVFRAIHTVSGQEVALKVIKADMTDPSMFIKRFMREAEIIALLKHPNIVALLAYGQDGNQVFLANQLLAGGSLTRKIHNAPLSTELVQRVLTQVASALDYAHSLGYIHRDVRPQNVLFDADDAAYLSDFGTNNILTVDSPLTATGTIIGTPTYLAPEQWSGASISAQTDIYSLGIMLFEMLAGRPPFIAETPFKLLFDHLNSPVPAVRGFRPEVSEAVQNVLDRALAKDPVQRFRSAGEFAGAFEQVVRP